METFVRKVSRVSAKQQKRPDQVEVQERAAPYHLERAELPHANRVRECREALVHPERLRGHAQAHLQAAAVQAREVAEGAENTHTDRDPGLPGQQEDDVRVQEQSLPSPEPQ